MPYLGSLVVAIAALLVLAALVVGALAPLRRLTAAGGVAAADLGERTALLSARLAALHARRAQRSGHPQRGGPGEEAPTIEMARSDRGSTP